MLELYHSAYSTCSQRVRMCLFEKELEWQSHAIALDRGEQLTDAYLKINPNGVVPTLVHDGRAITESSVIIEYLDESFPNRALSPADAYGKARLRAWLRFFDEIATASIRFPSLHVGQIAQTSEFDRAAMSAATERRPVRKFVFRRLGPDGFSDEELLNAFDGLRLTIERIDCAVATNPWIGGPAFSLADIMVAPTIDRMQDLGLGSMWSDLPCFSDWWRRLSTRASFISTYAAGARLSDRIPNYRAYAREAFASLARRTNRPEFGGGQ